MTLITSLQYRTLLNKENWDLGHNSNEYIPSSSNKSCIFLVPAILSEAMPATSNKVQNEIDTTLEMTYNFTGKSRTVAPLKTLW